MTPVEAAMYLRLDQTDHNPKSAIRTLTYWRDRGYSHQLFPKLYGLFKVVRTVVILSKKLMCLNIISVYLDDLL